MFKFAQNKSVLAFVLISFLLTANTLVRADEQNKKPDESPEAFVKRVLNTKELAQPVLQTEMLTPGTSALIAFSYISDQNDPQNKTLQGHLFVATPRNTYEHTVFTSCGIEGGDPQLASVFYIPTEKNAALDLAVLCQWDVRHATVTGTLYGAEFYQVKKEGKTWKVERLEDLNKKFSEKFRSCECSEKDENGKWSTRHSHFKNAADVKRLLKTLKR
jgi:hypothetical protein